MGKNRPSPRQRVKIIEEEDSREAFADLSEHPGSHAATAQVGERQTERGRRSESEAVAASFTGGFMHGEQWEW